MAVLGVESRAAAREGSGQRPGVLDGDEAVALAVPQVDLAEHLTTLFPPVRPRGYLELRTVDALDDSRWPVAAETAVTMVLDGPERRAALELACR